MKISERAAINKKGYYDNEYVNESYKCLNSNTINSSSVKRMKI